MQGVRTPLPPFLSGASPPVANPGEVPRGLAPPLFLDRKKFFRVRSPSPPPPPPPSQGLDLALPSEEKSWIPPPSPSSHTERIYSVD